MRIGVDIGGTTISIGLLDESGRIIRSTCTSSFGKEDSLEQTLRKLKDLIGSFLTGEVTQVGIGVPSALDREKGIVYNAINIPSWQNIPMKEILEDAFRVPVHLNNDANCYALGAYRHFIDEKPESLVCVTLGTGVGVGIVIGGELFNGNNTGAGEIGCIRYLDADLESYCSTPFFTRHGTTCKIAAEAMKAGDAQAAQLFDEFGRHMGHLVATILYAYDPEMLVLGGGISRAYSCFKQGMEACLQETFIYPESLKRLKIRQLDNAEIAVTGAAFLK